jgi:LuxR family maltose regulon positive regulatory protein
MTGAADERSGAAVVDDGRRARSSFSLSESKLRPPLVRPGIVPRSRLLRRLTDSPQATVVSLIAPAGYGKTTILAQWAARQPRVAWVSVDRRDNDPAVLLTYIAVALDRVETLVSTVFRALSTPGAGVALVPHLASAMALLRQPVTLVLDNAEAVTSNDARDVVTELALSLPPMVRLVVASRTRALVPAARLRAQGALVELGVDDLMMRESEARELLDEAGVGLPTDEVSTLVARTEGWPAGLYLAALAINAGRPARAVSITGDDRYVEDYLRSEILERASPAEMSFLVRTSILDRMTGPLCDATLDRRASSQMLERLESRNLLVIPLDRRRQWYRYHQLFRDLLTAELRRREPQLEAELHRRAAAWYEANGMQQAAIEHAQAAGDADHVARLVLHVMQPVWASGRVDTVLQWLEWLEDKNDAMYYGAVAVHGSLIFALLGRPGDAERWADAAQRAGGAGELPDGNSMTATLAYLRALSCREGIQQMRRDAVVAWDGFHPSSPYRATMLHAQAVAEILEGALDAAEPLLARACDLAASAGALPVVAFIAAWRGIVAIERDAWPLAEEFAEEAALIMSKGQYDEYWTSALTYAWLARVAVHAGDATAARDYVARAAVLRPLLSYALPVGSAQALLELARAYLGLGDAAGARAGLRQIQDIFQQRADLGSLRTQAAQLRSRIDSIAANALGASSLTTAELRLLPLLTTHLTLAEISQRLYLSRNTVKSQAHAVYRKLGVSSRSEAIERMHELGLLTYG